MGAFEMAITTAVLQICQSITFCENFWQHLQQFIKISATQKFCLQNSMDEESERSGSIIKLLIRCRLDMKAEKKKAVLWGRVLESMKAVNPEIKDSKEAIQRKFLNMLASYKRIKKRNKSTGRDATSWEYFEEFNAVYGSRHSIEPLLENFLSSLGSPTCEDSDCGDSDSYLGKKLQNETLTFLKAESSQEQKRHEELVQLEREKLEIEKEKISVLSALREILAKRI